MINKIIVGFVFALLFVIPNISALDFDNSLDFDQRGKYGTATIKNLFGFGDTLAEIELLDNSDTCSTDCYASGRTKLYIKSKLIDELTFELGDIKSYEVYIQTGVVSKEVFEYGQELRADGYYYNVVNGSHYENFPVWELYDGKELEPGEYYWTIEGKKEWDDTVDWIGEWMGVEVREWALWAGADGAFAYFTFNETAGNAIDIVDGITGVLGGNIVRDVSGILNNSYNFSEGIVTLNDEPKFDFASTFSISMWLNKSDPSGRVLNKWCSNGRSFSIEFNGADDIGFSLTETDAGTSSIAAVNLLDDIWYHTVFATNGSDMLMYINATLAGNAAYDGTIQDTTCNITIGQDGRLGADYFRGRLDEIGFWNRTLTQIEITTLYSNGMGLGFGEGLVIVLNTPANNSFSISETIVFNSSAITVDLSFINATIFIWNSTNDIVNQSTNLVTGQQNETIFNLSVPTDILEWNIFWCSTTTCSFADSNRTFINNFLVNSEEFNSATVEGAVEDFIINITIGSGLTLSSANLTYNGTTFIADTINQINLTTFSISKSLSIPDVNATVNNSFFWIFDIGVVNLSSTTNIQTVENIGVDNCTSSTNKILNFSVVDEELQTPLLADLEIAVNIFSLDRSVLVANLSQSSNSTSVSVCLNGTLTSSNPLVLDVVVKYSAENHEIEYYNIANSTLNSNTLSRNITLFDLNSNDSTPFKITFTGDNFLPVVGALVFLDRQYVEENNFKTVELPLTDEDGQSILHLVRNDIVYNIRFLSQSGTVLGNFEQVTAFCEDPLLQNCQITLSSISNISSTFNYDELTGLSFQSNPIFNSTTRIVSFSFVVPSGNVKTVAMNVTRNDVFGNRTVCQNSLTSSSGTLFCVVDSSISDTTLATEITSNGIMVLLSTVNISASTLGSIGYVVWFVMTLVLIFSVGDSKNGMLIALLIGYVGAAAFGLTNGTILGFGASGVWIIIVTVLGIWRLNRDKTQ